MRLSWDIRRDYFHQLVGKCRVKNMLKPMLHVGKGNCKYLDLPNLPFYSQPSRSMSESNPHLNTRAVAKELGVHHSNAKEDIKCLEFFFFFSDKKYGPFPPMSQIFNKWKIRVITNSFHGALTIRRKKVLDWHFLSISILELLLCGMCLLSLKFWTNWKMSFFLKCLSFYLKYDHIYQIYLYSLEWLLQT